MPAVALPSIGAVGTSFVEQIKSGQLIQDLSISLWRVMVGFIIAGVLGVLFGIVMAVSTKTNRFFFIVFEAIRQIPALAWVPLLIIWFGIGETSKIIMIAKSAFFPVLLNTMSGIYETPESYLELSQLYGLSKWQVLTKIYLPSAAPSIFVGLRLALGVGWTALIGAEMIASSSGIGYRINEARIAMEPAVVIVGMAVIGIVGVFLDRLIYMISKKATAWNNTQ